MIKIDKYNFYYIYFILMSIEEYNNELTRIKQFNTYLTNILEKGYMNELDDLKLLTKQIDNINLIDKTADFIDENIDNDYQDNDYHDSDYDCIPFIPSSKYNFSSSSSSPSSSSSSSSSDTEDEEYRLVSKLDSKRGSNIDKEKEKVNRFMITCTSNDIFQRCGNISLYKANGFDYIDEMKKFVKESFIY